MRSPTEETHNTLRPVAIGLGLAGILLIAAILRVLFLGQESLWVDEAWSVMIARLDWREFWKIISVREANMGLYYLFLRFWLNLGQDESVIRGLSVLFALASIPVIYLLGARMFGVRVGLISALLLSVNAFHIAYAQEARGYSLFMFLGLLSSSFLTQATEHPSRALWVSYTLTTALALYSHFFAGLLVVAHWASTMFTRLPAARWPGLRASTLAIVFLSLPLVVFAATTDVELFWIRRPELLDVVSLFHTLTGGLIFLLLLYFICCLSATLDAFRIGGTPERSLDRRRHGFLLTWLFVPIVVSFGVSFVRPIAVDRYLIICLPPLVMLAAVGITRLRPRPVSTAALVLLVGFALYSDVAYFTRPQKEDWRAATDFVLPRIGPRDAILFYSLGSRVAFDYYRERREFPMKNPTITFETISAGFVDSATQARLLQSLPARHPRVWLIGRSFQHSATRHAPIREFLAAHYPLVTDQNFHRVRILLFSKHR